MCSGPQVMSGLVLLGVGMPEYWRNVGMGLLVLAIVAFLVFCLVHWVEACRDDRAWG